MYLTEAAKQQMAIYFILAQAKLPWLHKSRIKRHSYHPVFFLWSEEKHKVGSKLESQREEFQYLVRDLRESDLNPLVFCQVRETPFLLKEMGKIIHIFYFSQDLGDACAQQQ